ncbi:hypothetical protein OG589_14420 [Sphaerisporangium sp. NBC_01403]|uniref:hypothetical protein n=1 Tax=Sphaerisporangium sp. NBC_01403 TaxID=2903599 RepID=UPI0032475450
MTTTQTVTDITAALDDRDLQTARRHFDHATQGRRDAVEGLVKQLAATVDIPKRTIVWGHGIDVWGNPHRYDFAWRCGDCRWTGSNYTTDRGARTAAGKHAAEHRAKGEPVPAVLQYGEEVPASEAC